ncbi:ligase-associated DNA damage response endonuclease PdeM [Siculibacillus lacustris]|uniref:Ligase-associated DNA damage response endonuclease PdeM n=1 Tax=Siculibacillus lacustris TaxID=1549641 RepID=A0A4Q9VQL9_9HYPH|nr:ligase-associated DNA damage response endonuclease PdeM [Siculibacillus lacustris]TBW37152.1 ligase-associated DNA damage response endonuclease PdeM [Siculibacillus lacustris]
MTGLAPSGLATIDDRAASDTFEVCGAQLTALPSGAAWWAREATLIVADLHFEKGSAFARRGALLPPHDTLATLARLAADVARTTPARVISLGDAFHDGFGPERMGDEARAQLAALQAGRDWVWVAGNHDAELIGEVGGRWVDTLTLGPLTFRHEPARGRAGEGEIAGHLHPAARVRVAAGTVRRHCFVGDGRRAILPAYGAYAGGLDIASRAFAGLFALDAVVVHLLGEGCVHRFPSGEVAGLGVNRDETARRRASR